MRTESPDAEGSTCKIDSTRIPESWVGIAKERDQLRLFTNTPMCGPSSMAPGGSPGLAEGGLR